MRGRTLFLIAYTSSGLAGLIYEVSWTRLLTLRMGHSTAATSTVVAAFMGGLAGGAALGGRFAPRLTPRHALLAYIILESAVAAIAIAVPFELAAVTPLLASSYRDGASQLLFPTVRLFSCLVIVMVPALALGATFPLAIRWFVTADNHRGRAGGVLYAVNTAGAAVGALAAGFVLLPRLGISGTVLVGVAASALAVGVVALVAKGDVPRAQTATDQNLARVRRSAEPRGKERHPGPVPRQERGLMPERRWLAAVALGFSGFASLIFEIGWTRVIALTTGPTTYAFAATLAVLIGGMAGGSVVGSWAAGRARRPAFWLAVTLAATAISVICASWLAGGYLPRMVARQLADSTYAFYESPIRHALMMALVIAPTALGLGAAFPLALEIVPGQERPVAQSFGLVYAINTLAAVAGSLIAGFMSIPRLGVEHTLSAVSVLLIIDAVIVITWSRVSSKARSVALVPVAAAVSMIVISPSWDRELLASGVYKYASAVDKRLDLDSSLKAGTLLYYRDGAVATVSVKRLTGTLSLAVDGKVDASNSGDMLTQKALAHLPLLLHPNPRDVFIIGLGSGVTVASALVHPVRRVDVVELSPEVVEASRYFSAENHRALDDPRTHLIVGDGRSHLLLSPRQYDVIVSEPSNPWMAGVASLFTREFFIAARTRLAPGGIVCQWAHTYDISDADLRSIVATFSSVFPDGTMWLIGETDVLLIASTGPLDVQLANLEAGWRRPGVAADLSTVAALEPFEFWSLFVGGPKELRTYGARATIQSDDRMALEFSGPRGLSSRGGSENASTLLHLLNSRDQPDTIRHAWASAGSVQWRNRGAMMFRSEVFGTAYDDYLRALALDPGDIAALDGLVQAAGATHREAQALDFLKASAQAHPQIAGIPIAASKLLASGGAFDDAIAAAQAASNITPVDPRAVEQLASIFADLGDATRLDPVVERLQQLQPDRVGSFYYSAASKFLHRDLPEALRMARRAVAIAPEYAAANNLLGAIYADLGEQQSAREAFQAALRLNGRESTTYINLGFLELASRNDSVAANYFTEALELDPGSAAARDGLARAQNRAN